MPKKTCFFALFFFLLIRLSFSQTPPSTGLLQGRILLSGNPSISPSLPVTKDLQGCGQKSVPEETIITDGHGGFGNVVAILKSQKNFPLPNPHLFVLDQKQCRFIPHVLVIPKESVVEFQNHDPIDHHVVIKALHGSSYVQAMSKYSFFRARINQPDLFSVECDLHPWMKAWIFATDSPFYQLSNEHGDFHFDEIPEGDYTLFLWHESLGTKQIPLHINAGRLARIDVIWTLPVRERPTD